MSQALLLAQNGGNAVAWGVGGFLFFWVVLAILALVLFIWALVDTIRNPALDGAMKIVWVLVILCLPILGAILYLLIGRSYETPRHHTYG